MKKLVKHNPFVSRIELGELGLSLAALACVGAWLIIFINPLFSRSPLVPFFISAGVATLLGSLARNIVRSYFNYKVRFQLATFIAEFVLGVIVAFMLFLLLQLGGVVVAGKAMSLDATDIDQSRRIMIAMSVVGFSASYLIETSLQRLNRRLAAVLDEATRER